MNRLARRLRLGRIAGTPAVSAALIAAEGAPRERAARLVRGALREGRPVILRHARWAALRWWFDDLVADLAVDPYPLDARVLEPLGLGAGPDAWSRVPDALSEALGVSASSRAASPTSRDAFRDRAATVFKRARARPRKAVLILGADLLGYELLQDLCDAWCLAEREMTPGTCPVLMLACRIGGQSLELSHSVSLFLPDPSPEEAAAMVAELSGVVDRELLETIVTTIGPVPGLLQAAGRAGAPLHPSALREAIAPVAREIAQAVEIVSGNLEHALRLEALAAGPQPFDEKPDYVLLRAGLVDVQGRVGPRTTRVRTPLVGEMLGL